MTNLKLVLAAVLVAFSSMTFAATTTYSIGNHADGALYDGSTNPYGLRLDDMNMTFSVGDNLPGTFGGGSLEISFDPTDLAAGAILLGTIVDNATGSNWNVNYSMSDLSAAPNGGFIAQAGSGMLTEVGGAGFFVFNGKSDGTGVFIFDDDGHRLAGDPGAGWVGRGWFEGSGSNDFLITASPVPVPAAIWMMGAALLGLFGAGRRK